MIYRVCMSYLEGHGKMEFLTDMIPMIEYEDISVLAIKLDLNQESVNKLRVIIKQAYLVSNTFCRFTFL